MCSSQLARPLPELPEEPNSKGTDQVRHAITQRSFRDSKGFAASRSTWSSRTEEIMYATRTTFAATTAVMAAKVELPMECKQVK